MEKVYLIYASSCFPGTQIRGESVYTWRWKAK